MYNQSNMGEKGNYNGFEREIVPANGDPLVLTAVKLLSAALTMAARMASQPPQPPDMPIDGA